MSDTLSPAERTRLEELMKAPCDENVNIDWSDNKERRISTNTWATKKPEVRLARARLDLMNAGFPADARLLTITRLNGAWYKLPEEERGDLLGLRNKDTSRGGAEASPKKQRRRRASKNKKVAKSIGLAESIVLNDEEAPAIDLSGVGGDSAAGAGAGVRPEDEARGFILNITPDSFSDDPRADARPLCGAVLVEGGQFDNKSTSVLIVRASSAGLGSKVEATRKVDERTVEVHVSRENKADFVEQMKPNGTADELAAVRRDVEDTCIAKYGKHVDYDVLNNAFRALVPEVEGWTLSVQVLPPYMIGDIKDVFMVRAGAWVDALMVVPLVKEIPDRDEGPIVMDL